MLKLESEFLVPELPEVLLYRDDQSDFGYFAIPKSPRFALDEQARPDINLVLYGHRQGTAFRLTGGLLAFTLTLELSANEEQIISAILARRLAEESRQPKGQAQPRPQKLSPDWLASEVTAKLTRDLDLRGSPSLVGSNRCSFNLKLSAASAQSLRDAWNKGLPDAHASYRLQLRESPASGLRVEMRGTSTSGRNAGQTRNHSSFEVRSTSAHAMPRTMTIAGPLKISAGVLARQLSEIDLS
ncbi:MAG: hypothetical protein ACREV1_08395 [Gammaproteobacteria bacterium]